MSPSPLIKSLERLTESRTAASLVSLALLLTGVFAVSVPLLILSGVVAYGWPFLNVYLSSLNEAPNIAQAPAHSVLNSALSAA
ncbi:hypothetical protein [Propionivibrio dicarboxylicus]|uniref:Uncharacterized protein n=1 Tax=Propionivibrio dicarboxylicus TaxID=83767 RepID=A0A1G8EUB5_9RHOO|nr:hypothetical protein [Propionivibrio dicarboxylicus]SDH73496.1 hypothetical protein SAMN05660652_02194 [Propionivibrio dicarboxylicus]